MKDTCWTVRCVSVSGDCDSFRSVSICINPSSCGCHAIFDIAYPLTPEKRKQKVKREVITCPITKTSLLVRNMLQFNQFLYNLNCCVFVKNKTTRTFTLHFHCIINNRYVSWLSWLYFLFIATLPNGSTDNIDRIARSKIYDKFCFYVVVITDQWK